METNITINAIELASNLADRELRSFYQGQIEIEVNEEEVMYTEDAQDVFNELYDEFLTMIEESKV
jgi:hypothetical protein